MGVLSDWIRPALKPLDTTVPIVNVSANVLPYGAPIFNNDDMVILQPHAVLPGVVYPTRYSQGQFIQFVYFSTGSWPHPARIWHWIPQSSVRSLLILLLPGTDGIRQGCSFFSWNFIQIFQYGFYVVASIWSRMCNWCKQSFQIFGGFFFLWMSFYVLKDKAKAEEESMLLEENQQQVWQPIQ